MEGSEAKWGAVDSLMLELAQGVTKCNYSHISLIQLYIFSYTYNTCIYVGSQHGNA